MRIAVIGAGAVGGAFAALLDRVGHEVVVTARGTQLAAIRAQGLALDGAWGEHLARVTAHDTLTSVPELAILTTKAQDAEAAITANLAALTGATALLVVQNGLGGTRVAQQLLPRSAVLGGIALFAASYLTPGRVTITAPLPTLLGAAPGTSRSCLEAVAGVIGEAMPVEIVDDLESAQWSKLLINHVNALPAITGLSVQETVADPRLLDVLAASLQESIRVAEAAGIRFSRMAGLSGDALRALGDDPPRARNFFRGLAQGMGDVPNPGSTLQSIRRGQPTEIDYLNGAVVREAQLHGVAAPVNATLVDLVHEVEESGRFLDPAEVAELFD